MILIAVPDMANSLLLKQCLTFAGSFTASIMILVY